MLSLFGIGLAELVILIGATGLVCGIPLVAALVIAIIILNRRETFPIERK